MLEGGGDRHSRRHHFGQAVDYSGEARLLGQQDRRAAHRALQGHWQVWLRHCQTYSGAERHWPRVRSCSEEAVDHGWYRRLLDLLQRSNRHFGKFRLVICIIALFYYIILLLHYIIIILYYYIILLLYHYKS